LAPDLSEIDAAMRPWRQGDIVLENAPFFLHLADLEHPIMNRSGFVGGSHFQIGWSRYEQNNEQILP
jgi:hypothetical protein